MAIDTGQLAELYNRRRSRSVGDRIRRLLTPPNLFILNAAEPKDFPLGHYNLYIGGAGVMVDGYINMDLVAVDGVDVVADAHKLPFQDGVFQRVECDAVLEHVNFPDTVMAEIQRVMKAGGYAHVVTPFCHPFHEFPKDYRRYTLDGLAQLAGPMEIVAKGWRTGPTATLLVIVIEYVKQLYPSRIWRIVSHGVLGWALFWVRYLDLILLKREDAHRIGNHCYIWFRKQEL